VCLPIVEHDVDPVLATILSSNHDWQEFHDAPPQSSGGILSSGSPAFRRFQLTSNSGRCAVAHSLIRRSAVRDGSVPASRSPSKVKVACWPWYSA
jgi:hypothetical protein